MRVSEISQWLECEKMALSSPKREGKTHVAAWLGTYAHALLLGPPLPKEERLRYDSLTPTIHDAKMQAHSIADYAYKLLQKKGWAVLEVEEEVTDEDTVGHLDFRAWQSDIGEAVIDLKTGRLPSAAWVQVGGYLKLVDKPIPWGGVLHVPRMKLGKDQTGTLEIRDSRGLMWAWGLARARVNDISWGAQPLYSPGQHCGRCNADCPVRIGEKRK